MAHRNDSKLATVGGTNISDSTVAWLQANGATSDNVNDAWQEYLAIVWPTGTGNYNTDLFDYLGSLGYTGALSDRLSAFWADGGGGVAPTPAWTYTTMAEAEAAGDAWTNGELIEINGILWQYKGANEVANQTGLWHYDPFQDGQYVTASIEDSQTAIGVTNPPNAWPNWSQTLAGGGSLTDNGGNFRLFTGGAGNSVFQKYGATVTADKQIVGAVIDPLWHNTGNTRVDMRVGMSAYQSASQRVSVVTNKLTVAPYETQVLVSGTGWVNIGETFIGTEQKRLWMYARSDGQVALYTDDTALYVGTGYTNGDADFVQQMMLFSSSQQADTFFENLVVANLESDI